VFYGSFPCRENFPPELTSNIWPLPAHVDTARDHGFTRAKGGR